MQASRQADYTNSTRYKALHDAIKIVETKQHEAQSIKHGIMRVKREPEVYFFKVLNLLRDIVQEDYCNFYNLSRREKRSS